MSNNDDNLDLDNLDDMLSKKFNLDKDSDSSENSEKNISTSHEEHKSNKEEETDEHVETSEDSELPADYENELNRNQEEEQELQEEEQELNDSDSFIFVDNNEIQDEQEIEFNYEMEKISEEPKPNEIKEVLPPPIQQNEVEEEVEEEKKERKRRGLIIIIPLLIGIILLSGIFTWVYLEQNKVNDHLETRLEKANKEIDSMIVCLDKLYEENKNLTSDNDSLNIILKEMEQKVNVLLQRIRGLQYMASKSNEYKTKAEELEAIKAQYAGEINQLKAKYERVVAENSKLKEQLQMCKLESSQIKEKSDNIEKKAKVLKGTAFIRTYDKKGRGTSQFKKVRKLKICVTVVANSLLESQTRQLYVALFTPKSSEPYKSKSNSIEIDGNEIKYTQAISLDFVNTKNTQKCIDIKFPKSKNDKAREKLYSGAYRVIVYSENGQFANAMTTLK